MKHIILITPGFTAAETDKNCLPTLQLYAQALQEQGWQVHIIALDYPFSNQPYIWQGIPVYPCGGRNRRWLKPRTVMRALNIGHDLLDRFPEAVLHSFWLSWPCAVAERLAQRRGIRHFTTLMGQDVLPANKKWFRYLRPEQPWQFIVLSEFHQQALQQNSGFRAPHIIPWGVADREIPAHISQKRPIDILGVGSLIPLKNWGKWLETVAFIKKTRPGINAVIVGDGTEQRRLKQLVRAFDLEQNVHFQGELPRPQVLETMQQSKIFLHTSNFESQGYVLMEAGMCGCHIVSTPVGIAPQLYPCANDVEALSALVSDALLQPVFRPSVPLKMSDTVKAYLQLYEA